MTYIDIHTHSHYSRATSALCTLAGLHGHAQLKGVAVVGTGDFTHPAYFRDLTELLVPGAPGLYELAEPAAAAASADVPPACRRPVRFMLTAEISSIYRRDGRCHKVHSLIAAPSLETAARLNQRLAAIGNLAADGRPILKLDPRDLLDMMLAIDGRCALIPAHIWTPWFAALGSKSGFDSIAACFGPYTRHIAAVETGLSSDPPMNWRVASLDDFTLVSSSDLHSPSNLGRNATCFHGEPDYFAIFDSLARRDQSTYGGTVNLYPEEGKYFADGHRACGFSCLPRESRALDNRCPRCNGLLTLGVLHRVEELATHPAGRRAPHAAPCRHIIPLDELVGECLGRGAASRAVRRACALLAEKCGPELPLLLDADISDAARAPVPRLAEALANMRAGKVSRRPGYDGVYGTVRALDQPSPA